MNDPKPNVGILIAEDDDDDYLLTQKAFESAHPDIPLLRVRDGVELMDFLLGRGPSGAGAAKQAVILILLDLNMPRKDGREALREIKSHPGLKHLPVVVLTTSQDPEEVAAAYDRGANSFIRKPSGFAQLVKAVDALKTYWLDVVELPCPASRRSERLP